jgi:nitrogen fixation/metabolism regulation signal transduction histidine kinase
MKKEELSGLRHNINNPLCIIQLQVEQIKRKEISEDDDVWPLTSVELVEKMNIIKDQVNKIAEYLKSIKEDV